MNPTNPPLSRLILSTLDEISKPYLCSGRVVGFVSFPDEPLKLASSFSFSSDGVAEMMLMVNRLISICQKWLSVSGNEFILDSKSFLVVSKNTPRK